MINIAIDGPAGAGKSTIAKAAARELGYIYVDTGALYRSIGLYMLQHGVVLTEEQAVSKKLRDVKIELGFEQGSQHVFLNGADVSEQIRLPEVSMSASKVSALPQVRAFLLDLQREIARKNNCIMDGRDIGTVVLPDADLKIFLTASPECRATRRYEELLGKGMDVHYEDVLREMKERDCNDSNRAIAPLRPAPDSVLVDTSGLSLKEAIKLMLTTIREGVYHEGV